MDDYSEYKHMSAFEKAVLHKLDAINTNLLDIAVMLALQHPDPEVRASGERNRFIVLPKTPDQVPTTKHESPKWRRERGFRYPEVRNLVLKLRSSGMAYTDIPAAVKEAFPDEPAKHISKSAAHRFFNQAKVGRLKEFNIEGVL